ncbi:MAG: T9SS type A sorting domain-containing protein [Ignavibacteriales bacterium]|nr:T9SS type A sorting domain-containing protein [Ignavibacteriales bacterium]
MNKIYFFILFFILPISIIAQISNSECFNCHSNQSLQMIITIEGGTEIIPLYVNETAYNGTLHGQLQCVQCHTDITASNLFTHSTGGANALIKYYGSWARFSKSDTTTNADGSPRTRNYYTTASLSCTNSGCHASKNNFTSTRHHTISRLKGSHTKDVNGDIVGENYDKSCSRCHTTCGTCHFETSKYQKVAGDVLAIWDSLQTLGETPFPNAAAMTEWSMDWTTNVESHNFVTPQQLTADNDVCRSCHVGYYRPATYGYLSEDPPYPTANGTSIKRHPQYYELLQSDAHSALTCANCHSDVHSYPDGDFDWQLEGDVICQDCHSPVDHYTQHTSVDCISCHATGFARSVGQDGHDVWRWPVNDRVRPYAVKYKEGLNWYPHNIEKPDPVTSCAAKCHDNGNLIGATVTGLMVDNEIPTKYLLAQNYPNPFNPATQITYSIPKTSMVSITVYNGVGETVDVLINTEQQPGNYLITFNGEGLATGMYFATIKAEGFVQTIKMMLLK